MQHSGRFIIIFFVYMIVVSGLLVAGIRSDIRQLVNTTYINAELKIKYK
jgi:hypothetical protein